MDARNYRRGLKNASPFLTNVNGVDVFAGMLLRVLMWLVNGDTKVLNQGRLFQVRRGLDDEMKQNISSSAHSIYFIC